MVVALSECMSKRIVRTTIKPLSPRERQIAAFVVWGHADKQVGAALGITRNTIRTYMAKILLKAGVESRVQLAVAWATGKLEPEKPVVVEMPARPKASRSKKVALVGR
jgi:DNA-binding NarL/FixJ family response regulator